MDATVLASASYGNIQTRAYQQEMLDESLRNNIIIALDTGSGKTHIAVLRLKIEIGREPKKVSWFLAPTVSLCEQQRSVIEKALPVSVGLISGSLEPDQWKNASLWQKALSTHRVMVSTPQVLLDALRHGYVRLGRDISLIVFDEAHHAVDNDPYNRIMKEFYFDIPPRVLSGEGEKVESSVQPDAQVAIVRPMILGLTASPIFGGNVEKAFRVIEGNLDSVIRAPRHTREELAKHVHRPEFKHVMHSPPSDLDPPFSTNLAALQDIIGTLDIENDPYVISLRAQLDKAPRFTDQYRRLDQKLSKIILTESTFTHKGLKDFARTAEVILFDMGAWATDWYVWAVLQKAKAAATPNTTMMSTWHNAEKKYLLSILTQIRAIPVSYHEDDILADSSDKVRVLVQCLLEEKETTEMRNEAYSGLIFVQRRDSVLALAELLSHHPVTGNQFRVGALLGTSDSSRRHSFLDITTRLRKERQDAVLMDFKIGVKNLIVSTAVAEEGIDVQACGCVIRWDPPPNIVSWAQSRGRARKHMSSFTLIFERGGKEQLAVAKWEQLEKEMVARYTDPTRDLSQPSEQEAYEDEEYDEYCVESTGALVNTQSAVPHLAHFCAVIPDRGSVEFRPLYDIDPAELPLGWHSSSDRTILPYSGPWGCQVTLPRLIHQDIRIFSTPRIHKTKIAAYQHAAFKAYLGLYQAKLLDDNLLPFTYRGEDIEELLKEVEKRKGTANVSLQMNPWTPDVSGDIEDAKWFSSEVTIEGMAPLYLLTRSQPPPWVNGDGPMLYLSGHDASRLKVTLRPADVSLSDEVITFARSYTRRLFWGINGSRMDWNCTNFAYLILPSPEHEDTEEEWEYRRAWLASKSLEQDSLPMSTDAFNANAEEFGEEFFYPTDLSMVRAGFGFSRSYRFVRWRHDNEPLTEEEEAEIRERYSTLDGDDYEIPFPLLVVETFPPRTNFLIPHSDVRKTQQLHLLKTRLLIPKYSSVVLLSPTETKYALLLPSILRSLAMAITAQSFRTKLLTEVSPLFKIPCNLLITALTTPLCQEKPNYQRLETLGDTVLKFVTGIQLLAEYPLWHEGYLSKKKDHSVSNVRLAKESILRKMYHWIIRDQLVGKKWKPSMEPSAVIDEVVRPPPEPPAEGPPLSDTDAKKEEKKKKKKKQALELSTKVLADVVEAVIGAAYLHGGFSLGYEACKFFDLGIKSWHPLPDRCEEMIQRIEKPETELPAEVAQAEAILGYTFTHKLLLVEALTHASYQPYGTISYERMEFLGDSVLDMVVTDYLYRAPGKEYSPGHIHLRKSAVVNAHILAYLCLCCSRTIESSMPRPDRDGKINLETEETTVHLYKCLLYSNTRVFEDQTDTFRRLEHRRAEIREALEGGKIFPWALLTRLQAPKFLSDMVESLIGAAFLDSRGDWDVVRQIMRRLGVLQLLERIVQEDVDILHPLSRLSLWRAQAEKQVRYEVTKERGNVSCVIEVEGEEIPETRVTDIWRGRASEVEVKFAAAEEAIRILHLRGGKDDDLLKGRGKVKKPKTQKTKVPA